MQIQLHMVNFVKTATPFIPNVPKQQQAKTDRNFLFVTSKKVEFASTFFDVTKRKYEHFKNISFIFGVNRDFYVRRRFDRRLLRNANCASVCHTDELFGLLVFRQTRFADAQCA